MSIFIIFYKVQTAGDKLFKIKNIHTSMREISTMVREAKNIFCHNSH